MGRPEQMTLWPDYPEVPGRRATDTSAAAAEAVAARAASVRDLALRHLSTCGPATADEVAAALRMDILTVRPRMSELRRMGAVDDSGARRANASGRQAIVWEAR